MEDKYYMYCSECGTVSEIDKEAKDYISDMAARKGFELPDNFFERDYQLSFKFVDEEEKAHKQGVADGQCNN